MWCSAERRFVRHVCSRNLFPLHIYSFGISHHPLPTRSRFMRGTVRSTSSAILWLHHALLQKKTFLVQRSRGFGHGVVVSQICNTVIVSKIWITGYWLRSHLWHVTAANPWTVVEIELLATVGWKWGCQPFSCRCSLNVMHCRKQISATVCLRNPWLLWNLSLRSRPEAWGPWEGQYAPPILHYACSMPIPSLQLKEEK